MSKKKQVDYGLGDFMIPVVEVISIFITNAIEFVAKVAGIGIEKFILKREDYKKIERKDLDKSRSTTDFNTIGYSTTSNRKIKPSDINKEKHSIVVGASGSGKSVLMDSLMFSDMREGKPVIYIDPKGDNESLERFIDICRLNNREYQIFSEYYDKDNSITLNPVMGGSVNNIADRVFKSFDWSEEYYANKAYQALKLAIQKLKDEGQIVSLVSILDKVLELTKSKLKRKDIEGLITKLDTIVSSDFKDKLCGNLGFHELQKQNKCIYIGLSVLGYSETARSIGKLILGDINYSVYKTYRSITYKSKRDLSPVALYIDELGAVVTNEFVELLNKCRGAKFEITTAIQSSSDLIKISKELCEQVFENSLNWFIMKQRLQDGASFISNAVGTVESTKKTVRVEGDNEQEQGSQRKVEELLVHPNLIKNLNVGQCILLRQQPTRIDLINVKYIDQKTINGNLELFELNNEIKKREAKVSKPIRRTIKEIL